MLPESWNVLFPSLCPLEPLGMALESQNVMVSRSGIPELWALESWWAVLEPWGNFPNHRAGGCRALRVGLDAGAAQAGRVSSRSHRAELTSPSRAFWGRVRLRKPGLWGPGQREGQWFAVKGTIKGEILESSSAVTQVLVVN